MPVNHLLLQPTLAQLLQTEALSEARVLSGERFVERAIQQVVVGFAAAKPQSLVVLPASELAGQEIPVMKDIAGLIVIAPDTTAQLTPAAAGSGGRSRGGVEATARTANANDANASSISLWERDIERLTVVYQSLPVPVVKLAEGGDLQLACEEIRMAFQSELSKLRSRLQAHFLSLVLGSGLQELVAELATIINHPVAVETADFKLLASENMGSTPPNQQRTLTEEVAEDIQREARSSEEYGAALVADQAFKLGRRLVMPIVLEDAVVGYLSVMMKPADDVKMLSEYMRPAVLAALVDFSHRRKEVGTYTVEQKSLLKDLLSGNVISAGDQARLEQHYGFDLCEGFLVLVVQAVPSESARNVRWPDDRYPVVEMETARAFVLTHDSKQGITWQQQADAVLKEIERNSNQVKLQVGAGRIAPTLLDVPDAYSEARQALIIGSLAHPGEEFSISYTDLGIKRLLYLLFDHPELDRFYEETLAPLEAYDAEWEAELIPTLKVYLEHGANLNSAAKALFIHRHTMRYRLEQIAEILVQDIDSPEVLLNLQIAFLIREMKGQSND